MQKSTALHAKNGGSWLTDFTLKLKTQWFDIESHAGQVMNQSTAHAYQKKERPSVQASSKHEAC